MPTPTAPDRDQQLVGTYRRFGDFGPSYQVVAVHEGKADLEFPESGETVTMPVEAVHRDPVDD